MNEKPKTVEALADKILDELEGKLKSLSDDINPYDAAVEGIKQAQSDPAFIADVVRQTLEYVQAEADYKTDVDGEQIIDRLGILNMHPEIVNNIINKK